MARRDAAGPRGALALHPTGAAALSAAVEEGRHPPLDDEDQYCGQVVAV
jgi:hypothetical protein